MATVRLIEYDEAPPEVRAVYDDIRATRQSDFINNFWKALAHSPAQLQRTWEAVKTVMAPRRSRRANQGADLHRRVGGQ